MLLDGWRRAYAAGAAWRSIGHLTTYGPTDNPTFVTTFSPFPNRQIETNESRTRTTYIAIAVPPGVIPTLISDITDQEFRCYYEERRYAIAPTKARQSRRVC